jgi:D-alanyl-lipoteichoic acid acyltransferase DltB (MBOAT superfamily)
LFSGIALVLLPLLFYKYWPVIVELLGSIFSLSWSYKGSYILPVGISFYTFVSIGYLVDVYQEEVEAERNFGVLALFLSFFPLTLSGPIERANRMLPQVRESRTIDYLDLTSGFKLMLWGYFMKLVLADRLGQYIDVVYGNVQAHNGTTLLFTALLYPIQVYGDLGGYSLIAIGTSRMLGFRVRENFRRPFFATTMSEFWNRWHISLIKWLTDYVYTPLSFLFRKFGLGGIVLALMLTFIISGLWHGAAATFLVWGIMQGLFLSVEAISKRSRSRMERRFNLTTRWWYIVLGCASTYVLFAASQIFARSKNIDEAMLVYTRIASEPGGLFIDYTVVLFAMVGIFFVMVKDLYSELKERGYFNYPQSKWIQYSFYCMIFYLILFLGELGEEAEFLYFKY